MNIRQNNSAKNAFSFPKFCILAKEKAFLLRLEITENAVTESPHNKNTFLVVRNAKKSVFQSKICEYCKLR